MHFPKILGVKNVKKIVNIKRVVFNLEIITS